MAYQLMKVSERTWAALAMIESEQPKGETECAIVVQMACVHAATMSVLGRFSGAYDDRSVLAAATAASRLSRWLRGDGSQVIRIERVDVRDRTPGKPLSSLDDLRVEARARQLCRHSI